MTNDIDINLRNEKLGFPTKGGKRASLSLNIWKSEEQTWYLSWKCVPFERWKSQKNTQKERKKEEKKQQQKLIKQVK